MSLPPLGLARPSPGLPEAVGSQPAVLEAFHKCDMDALWTMEVWEGPARYKLARAFFTEEHARMKRQELMTIGLQQTLQDAQNPTIFCQDAWKNLCREATRIGARLEREQNAGWSESGLINLESIRRGTFGLAAARGFEPLKVNGRFLWKASTIVGSRWYAGAEPGAYIWYHTSGRAARFPPTVPYNGYPVEQTPQYAQSMSEALQVDPLDEALGDMTNFIYRDMVPRPMNESQYRFNQIAPSVVRILASIVCLARPRTLPLMLPIMAAKNLSAAALSIPMVQTLTSAWAQSMQMSGSVPQVLWKYVEFHPLLNEFASLIHELDKYDSNRPLRRVLSDALQFITGISEANALRNMAAWDKWFAEKRLFHSHLTSNMLIYHDDLVADDIHEFYRQGDFIGDPLYTPNLRNLDVNPAGFFDTFQPLHKYLTGGNPFLFTPENPAPFLPPIDLSAIEQLPIAEQPLITEQTAIEQLPVTEQDTSTQVVAPELPSPNTLSTELHLIGPWSPESQLLFPTFTNLFNNENDTDTDIPPLSEDTTVSPASLDLREHSLSTPDSTPPAPASSSRKRKRSDKQAQPSDRLN